MIKFYIRISQLHNFLDLKEPVQFVPYIIADGYVEMIYDAKDVIINTYTTHATIELKKKGNKLWQKLKSIHKKN